MRVFPAERAAHLVRSYPRNVLDLALIDTGWICRRVESMRMDDAGATAVRVSLDVLMRASTFPIGPSGGVVLPLALAQKGPMSRLDVSHWGGSISVLTTAQNAELVATALVELATGVVTSPGQYRDRFVELAVARPHESDQVHAGLVRDMEEIKGVDPDARWLFRLVLEQLVEAYVLLVEVHGPVAERTTIKYSYDAGSTATLGADVRANRLTWSLGTYGMAGSSHVEVEVPFPLVIEESRIDESGDGLPTTVAESLAPSGIHHLVAVPRQALSSAVWTSSVKVAESTATRTALFASTSSAVLCAYLFVGTWEMWLLGNEGLVIEPSTSLLLAVAGAMGPVVGRAPRHWLVAKFVKPFRDITTAAGSILFATAVVVGTIPREPLRMWLQLVLLGAALALTIVALCTRPRVSGRRTLVSRAWRR